MDVSFLLVWCTWSCDHSTCHVITSYKILYLNRKGPFLTYPSGKRLPDFVYVIPALWCLHLQNMDWSRCRLHLVSFTRAHGFGSNALLQPLCTSFLAAWHQLSSFNVRQHLYLYIQYDFYSVHTIVATQPPNHTRATLPLSTLPLHLSCLPLTPRFF